MKIQLSLAAILILIPLFLLTEAPAETELSRLFNQAVELEEAGQFPEAEVKFQELLKSFEQKKDRQGIANTLLHLGRTQNALSRFKEAIVALEKAERIHSALNNRTAIGEDITERARSHNLLGNIDESMKLCNKAMKIHEETGNLEAISKTFRIMSNCHSDRGNFESALICTKNAYDVAVKIGNEDAKGSALMQLGSIYNLKSEHMQALEYFNQAMSIFERTGKQHMLADVLVNAGASYSELGEVSQSVEYYRRAGAVFEKVGDRYGIAVASNNMGVSYYRMGEYGKALESFKRMYEIESETGSKTGQAQGLSNIAYVLQELGEFEQAMNYFEKSLKICEESGEKLSIALALFGIAICHEQLGQYKTAINIYKRVYEISSGSGFKKYEADSLMKIAVLNWTMGDSKTVLDQLQKSAVMFESLGHQIQLSENYLWIGTVHLENRNLEQAEEALLKSLAISNATGYLIAQWPALHKLGLIYRDTQRVEEAVKKLQESVELIERSRNELRMAEQKTGFFETKVDVYEDLVSLLVSLNRDDEAFQYVQRSKARGFVDLLAEAQIDPNEEALDPQLRSKKRKLQADLMIIHNQIQEESEKENSDKAKLQDLIRKRNNLEILHSNLVLEIRKQNLQYANVKYPVPLRLNEAQALLDKNTVLLEYYIRKSTSLLFAITNKGVKVFRLPDGGMLREQTETLRNAILKADPVFETIEKAHSNYILNALLLYSEVFKPAESIAAAKKRIIFAPDGALNYLPFESLLTKRSQSDVIDFSKLSYLARKYEIQYIPSASVLASVVQREKRPPAQNEMELLAFANPHSSSSVSPGSESGSRIRSAAGSLAPLPHAKTEVEEIAGLFRKENVTVLIGPEASEKKLKNLKLQSYRKLHFASHALIDEERPEFSALILTGDEDGNEDGYLTMREVFDLKLNADLVVLSACKTGLGKEFSGEGINGISRAFLLAGTPSVVVSLWDVYDRSTADLMTAFYRNMKKGEGDKAAALRNARMEMIRTRKFSHPYYWAPFVLIGDR